MDKHKNADRHKIYPGFREFGLYKLKTDITLKEEYQCSKCGEKIKIDDYKKWKRRSNLIQWLMAILQSFSLIIFGNEAMDAFSKIVLTYYKVPEFLLWVLDTLFVVVVVWLPLFMVLEVAVWLERVIFLKWYCVKLQKSGTDPCPGEKTE